VNGLIGLQHGVSPFEKRDIRSRCEPHYQ